MIERVGDGFGISVPKGHVAVGGAVSSFGHKLGIGW
jgi:hypothetical protein